MGDFKPRKLISDSFGFQCLFDFPGVWGLRNAFDNVSCSTFEGIATFKGRSLRNRLKPSVLKWRRRIEIALVGGVLVGEVVMQMTMLIWGLRDMAWTPKSYSYKMRFVSPSLETCKLIIIRILSCSSEGSCRTLNGKHTTSTAFPMPGSRLIL